MTVITSRRHTRHKNSVASAWLSFPWRLEIKAKREFKKFLLLQDFECFVVFYLSHFFGEEDLQWWSKRAAVPPQAFFFKGPNLLHFSDFSLWTLVAAALHRKNFKKKKKKSRATENTAFDLPLLL